MRSFWPLWVPGGIRNCGPAVDGRHFDLRAQRGLVDTDRHA